MTRFGLRVAWNQPAVVLAEIVWRWCFGAASLLVLALCAVHYLHSLVVTDAQMLMLRTNSPPIMAEAVQEIFAGTGPLLLRIVVIAIPAIAVLWWLAASLGRTVTLRALMPARPPRLRTQFGVHFLRVVNSLLALAAMVLSTFIAAYAAVQGDQPNQALFILVFLVLVLIVSLIRSRINYVLALASVAAPVAGVGTGRAIGAALGLFRRRSRMFMDVGGGIGVLKFIAAVIATVLSIPPLLLVGVVPAPLWIALLVLVALLYFLVADFLNLARLVAWLAIAETDSVTAEMKTAGAVTPAV